MDNRVTDPREVVEVYRHPEKEEVVLSYIRPLPPPMVPKPPSPSAKLKKRRKKGIIIFLIALVLAVLGAVAAYFLPQLWEEPEYEWGGWEEPDDTEDTDITIPAYPVGQGGELVIQSSKGTPLTPQEIYAKVNPAVVTVMVKMSDLKDFGPMSVGTGVIFTEDGYILTNHHVVSGGKNCSVMLDTGTVHEAKFVAGDAENDLAVLKMEKTGLSAAEFADSDLLAVGDTVYAIGNPLGIELRGTFTDGIVSAINRDVVVGQHSMTLIQTNAALNSGNSGGPLVNDCGQVVGINVVKMMSRYDTVEGLGFAIPTASMERIVADLLAYGEVKPIPTLGIMVKKVGVDLGDGLVGIEVDSVDEGSVGEAAGIVKGDFIVEAGGSPIHTSQALLRVRNRCHIGDELPIKIWRNGQIMDVTLKLDRAGG